MELAIMLAMAVAALMVVQLVQQQHLHQQVGLVVTVKAAVVAAPVPQQLLVVTVRTAVAVVVLPIKAQQLHA
jgi:hypothetical protein